jgi:hypothetical protein
MPVVDRHAQHRLLGMVSLNDLLEARVRDVHEERDRERVLRLRLFWGSRRHTPKAEVHV